MLNSERPLSDAGNVPGAGPSCCPAVGRSRFIVMALVLSAFIVAGIIWLCHNPQNGNAQPLTDEKPPSPLFRNWGKPAVAIVLTGQMYGYMQPCGCSEPQYGGLARRYNFLQSLKEKGWPIVPLDLGDLAASGGPQAMLKFKTTMQALDAMDYYAVGLGKNEFNLNLLEVLGYKINNKPEGSPFLVASNLKDDLNPPLIKPWVVAHKGAPTVGVACLIGPSVVKQVRNYPNVTFSSEDNKKVLQKILGELSAQQPSLVALLYQGTAKEARNCAEYCATLNQRDGKLPRVNVILCLEEEEEPSDVPKIEGNTMIIGIGHKGRNVGVVGVFRDDTTGSFELKYQRVAIGPEYKTVAGKEAANPILALMQEYTREVKAGDYLSKFPRTKHPVQIHFPNAKYVGSDRCGDCHIHAYKIWKETRHAHAFATLTGPKVKQPLRQFDGECVVCHTVGFEHPSGYADNANNVKRNTLLENVGCESCHGPGSAHVNNPQNIAIHSLMNPYKSKAGEEGSAAQKLRQNQLDRFCQKCHDIDNDVHWGKVPFQTKWQLIAHPTPIGANGRKADN